MGQRLVFLTVEVLSVAWVAWMMFSLRHRITAWREWLTVIVSCCS